MSLPPPKPPRGGVAPDQEHSRDRRSWAADMATWTIVIGLVGAVGVGRSHPMGQLPME